ncbi:hypothetical protein GE061_011457, partial [Apolygus lucorum]
CHEWTAGTRARRDLLTQQLPNQPCYTRHPRLSCRSNSGKSCDSSSGLQTFSSRQFEVFQLRSALWLHAYTRSAQLSSRTLRKHK